MTSKNKSLLVDPKNRREVKALCKKLVASCVCDCDEFFEEGICDCSGLDQAEPLKGEKEIDFLLDIISCSEIPLTAFSEKDFTFTSKDNMFLFDNQAFGCYVDDLDLHEEAQEVALLIQDMLNDFLDKVREAEAHEKKRIEKLKDQG